MSSRPACRYQPACPGCPRFDEPGVDPSGLAELVRLTEEFGGPAVEVMPGSGRGYRCRVRLSVRGSVGDCRVGIFEARSHRLVHIPHCPVHHETITEILPRFVKWANEARIAPYDERTHTGLLRAVQLAVERSSRTVQVVLLLNHDLESRSRLDPSLLRLERLLRDDPRVHSLWFAALPDRTNSLLADSYDRRFGKEMLRDECGGASVFFPPDAFGQANLDEHDRVVQRIFGFVEKNDSVMEYYAGVGTIGLGLAKRGQRVGFNEIGRGSVRGLIRGWENLFGPGTKPPLVEGRAGDHVGLYAQEQTVIVDPPRKGLDPELLEQLRVRPAARLIYLSCGLEPLLHEARRLLDRNTYQLCHLSAWSYFPFTNHIETLMVLERGGP